MLRNSGGLEVAGCCPTCSDGVENGLLMLYIAHCYGVSRSYNPHRTVSERLVSQRQGIKLSVTSSSAYGHR